MDRLEIGEVLKPQGIRGEVKIRTFTDENVPVSRLKRLFIGGEEYKVLSFRDGEAGFAYLGLRGVPDRNAAELLRISSQIFSAAKCIRKRENFSAYLPT